MDLSVYISTNKILNVPNHISYTALQNIIHICSHYSRQNDKLFLNYLWTKDETQNMKPDKVNVYAAVTVERICGSYRLTKTIHIKMNDAEYFNDNSRKKRQLVGKPLYFQNVVGEAMKLGTQPFLFVPTDVRLVQRGIKPPERPSKPKSVQPPTPKVFQEPKATPTPRASSRRRAAPLPEISPRSKLPSTPKRVSKRNSKQSTPSDVDYSPTISSNIQSPLLDIHNDESVMSNAASITMETSMPCVVNNVAPVDKTLTALDVTPVDHTVTPFDNTVIVDDVTPVDNQVIIDNVTPVENIVTVPQKINNDDHKVIIDPSLHFNNKLIINKSLINDVTGPTAINTVDDAPTINDRYRFAPCQNENITSNDHMLQANTNRISSPLDSHSLSATNADSNIQVSSPENLKSGSKPEGKTAKKYTHSVQHLVTTSTTLPASTPPAQPSKQKNKNRKKRRYAKNTATNNPPASNPNNKINTSSSSNIQSKTTSEIKPSNIQPQSKPVSETMTSRPSNIQPQSKPESENESESEIRNQRLSDEFLGEQFSNYFKAVTGVFPTDEIIDEYIHLYDQANDDGYKTCKVLLKLIPDDELHTFPPGVVEMSDIRTTTRFYFLTITPSSGQSYGDVIRLD